MRIRGLKGIGQARQDVGQGNGDEEGEDRHDDGDQESVLEGAQHVPLQTLDQ